MQLSLISMSINFLFLGEIVGRAGIQSIKSGLAGLKEKYNPDYIVANAEGTTNGFGLGRQHSAQLFKMGIDLLTGGEKLFYKADLVEVLPKSANILKPANLPPTSPGRGYKLVTLKDRKIAIVNLLSSSGFRFSVQNPLSFMDYLYENLRKETDSILIQFHSATTAETATLAHYLDGKVAALIGTHSKAISADAHIMDRGTAFMTDNGRCGSIMSAGGFNPDFEIKKLITALPERSHEAWDDCELQGAYVEINEATGFAQKIEGFRYKVDVKRPEGDIR